MPLHLYNTLSRTIEPFKPRRPDEVKVYYCGPTPYNYAHIGNLRNYLVDDFIVKTLRFLGYHVKTTMNITDIDDKTIRDSQKSGKSLKDFTEYYTREFLRDLEKLSIEKADNIKPISELIEDMGEIIDGLIQKGYAYLADDGSIYYSVRKFEKYGNLAHLDVSGMISSVRIDNDEYDKEQVADFALWKAYDPEADGDNWWEIEITVGSEEGSKKSEESMLADNIHNNPLGDKMMRTNNGGSGVETVGASGKEENGRAKRTSFSTSDGFGTFATKSTENVTKKIKIKGRPGWHIECSACNKHFFGDQIDIHMGGIDLVFPHHQNEIAQTEAYTGKEFSKYWLHGGHLLVDNKKMAKSAGNFYTLRDIVERMKTPPLVGEAGRGTLPQDLDQKTPPPPLTGGQEVLIYRGFRLMGLQNQYRENFNFTFDRLSAAINTIKGLDEMMKRLGRYQSSLRKPALSADRELNSRSEDGGLDISERNARGRLKFPEISREFRYTIQAMMQAFVEKLEDDFDTNNAMTVVFELQGYINTGIDEKVFSLEEVKSLIDLLKSWDQVITILDFSLLETKEEIPENIQKLALDRYDAKLAKNWAEADRIRDELANQGWKMIDEKDGWRVEKM